MNSQSTPIYSANQIADWFISQVDMEAGDVLSHLKLQKLLYYAQAWHFTLTDKPLIGEGFEAWMHGPVVRSVYERFRHVLPYSSVLTPDVTLEVPEFESGTLAILEDIRAIYGEHSGSYLEDLTHSEAPWIRARAGLPPHAYCDNEISLESMKEYYTDILGGREA